MAKTLWFLLKPALVMVGIVTLLYPVLLLLCFATGGSSLFFGYLQGFFVLYDVMIGICAAQAISGYAPLALSFGTTRRSLRGAAFGFCLIIPLLCLGLDLLCSLVTTRLFYAEMNQLIVALTEYPLPGFGYKLLLCSAMLWLGTLDFSALPMAKRVGAILLIVVVYMQMMVFMLLSSFLPHTVNFYGLVLGLLSLPFAALTLHRLKHFTITQV